MLRPSAAGSVEEGHAISEARRGSGVATKEVVQAYEPSRAHRWLVMMLSGLVLVSVVLRFPRERGVVSMGASAVSCEAARSPNFGRAAPGTVLSDAGGCVNVTSLDAGVCVEFPRSGWFGGARVRCVPTVAVIGAMKSGTTNIMLYLQMHPQLRTSENAVGWPVESRFFSSATDPEAAAESWRAYLALYPPARTLDEADRVLTFDKSPNYLPNAIVPAVLARLAPSLKLVVMLRDPTKRAYSHLQHECRNGRLRRDKHGALYRSTCVGERAHDCGPKTSRVAFPAAPGDFQALVDAELAAHPAPSSSSSSSSSSSPSSDAAEDWTCAWARGKDGRGDSNVIPRGFYDCQINRWLAFYPKRQLKALIFEEFLASTQATLDAVRAVEDFVGVPNFDYAASPKVAAVQKLYAAVPSRGGNYAPMLPKTKQALDALYCDPNMALAATLGRPLPWPCAAQEHDRRAPPRARRSA